MLVSTYFWHYYAHHQELTTVMLITTWAVRFLGFFWLEGYSLQSGHLSSLPAPNFQPTATEEPDGPCGTHHYSRELLMMGIIVPETCWAYHKYNKTISGIELGLILQLSQRCKSSTHQIYLIPCSFLLSVCTLRPLLRFLFCLH